MTSKLILNNVSLHVREHEITRGHRGKQPEFWDCCERNFSSKVDFAFEGLLDFEESHLYWFIEKE